MDLSQGVAPVKCSSLDGPQRGREGNIGQILTFFKSMGMNVGHTLREGHAVQLGVAVKGLCADKLGTFRDHKIGQLLSLKIKRRPVVQGIAFFAPEPDVYPGG